MIINAHNFGGSGFSPAVNGKMPIAAWIPSRDDAGNGTTTLTDLVGSNHGTLTNMDAATDWVVDMGAGGVRALDFDGSNDYVVIPHDSVLNPGSNAFLISCWIKPPNSNQYGPICQKRNADGGIGQVIALTVATSGFDATPGKKISLSLLWNGTSVVRSAHTESDVADGNWHHVVAAWTGSAIKIYVDGVDQTLTVEATAGTVSVPMSPTGPLRFGTNVPGVHHYAGQQDDIRMWHQILDATEIAALATGRGVDVA